MPDAVLNRITIYPIKSLDGVSVDGVRVLANGALEEDRRFALVDAAGQFVNGKRTTAVHRVHAVYDLQKMTVQLRDKSTDAMKQFSLVEDACEIGRWCSDALGIACVFAENASGGFPDDTDAPGPTLISTATLREVAGWFPGLSLDEARRRFRANLEIDGVEPFWEDQLVAANGHAIPFQIGEIRWLGVNPCQRCVVPSRGSDSGEAMPMFQKLFAAERERKLPSWSPRERFDHFYRLAVNTRPAPGTTAGRVSVGDPVGLTRRDADS